MQKKKKSVFDTQSAQQDIKAGQPCIFATVDFRLVIPFWECDEIIIES